MGGEFKYQGNIYQELEEWLSPRGIQYSSGLFSGYYKQDYA